MISSVTEQSGKHYYAVEGLHFSLANAKIQQDVIPTVTT